MPHLKPKAYIITGPTSGYGRQAALELAPHGTLILVGRNRSKLDEVVRTLTAQGHKAVAVLCDLSDLNSVQRAVKEIIALSLPMAGLLNNAGIQEKQPQKSAQGFDNIFATNHLGPFVFTQLLLAHLPDEANVLFVVSAVEDPHRTLAVRAGFRGGRYISAEASARGAWEAGGARVQGFDAYATSKQAALACALALAREVPRLHINAVEPGFAPSTGLGMRDVHVIVRCLAKYVLGPLLPLILRQATTPKRAGKVLAQGVLNSKKVTGVYLDERGAPMRGSDKVHDTAFQDRVVTETRALLREHGYGLPAVGDIGTAPTAQGDGADAPGAR